MPKVYIYNIGDLIGPKILQTSIQNLGRENPTFTATNPGREGLNLLWEAALQGEASAMLPERKTIPSSFFWGVEQVAVGLDLLPSHPDITNTYN